jgi:hypothetical protein
VSVFSLCRWLCLGNVFFCSGTAYSTIMFAVAIGTIISFCLGRLIWPVLCLYFMGMDKNFAPKVSRQIFRAKFFTPKVSRQKFCAKLFAPKVSRQKFRAKFFAPKFSRQNFRAKIFTPKVSRQKFCAKSCESLCFGGINSGEKVKVVQADFSTLS